MGRFDFKSVSVALVLPKFHNEFSVMEIEPAPLVNRREKESPGAKKRSKAQQRKALPNIIPVYRDRWEKYGMNEESAIIRRSGTAHKNRSQSDCPDFKYDSGNQRPGGEGEEVK